MPKIGVTCEFSWLNWSISELKRQYVWHSFPQPKNVIFFLRNIILKIFPHKTLSSQLNRPCKFEQKKATYKLSTFVQIKLRRIGKKSNIYMTQKLLFKHNCLMLNDVSIIPVFSSGNRKCCS